MKKQPQKKPKKTTSVVVVEKKKTLNWGGVMPKVANQESDNAKLTVFCNQVAEIYGVPSLGVNAMGGQPYLNKDGRLYLLNDLRTGKSGVLSIRKEFLQMSTNIDTPAIIKVTIAFRDGHEIEAIGEASKQSVKLEAVKQTLNMMAETRATNRAIWLEIGGDVWKRIAVNLKRDKTLDDQTKARIVDAGTVSYEEMQQPRAKAKPTASTPEELLSVIKDALDKAKTVDVVIDLDEKTQTSPKLNVVQKAEIHKLALAKVGIIESGVEDVN